MIIARNANDKTPFLNLKSWATNEAATKILKAANLNLDELREKAKSRDFQPVKTGLNAKVDLKSETKSFDSPNVAGIVEGSDKNLKNEYVIYSAHWDHLGVGEADKTAIKSTTARMIMLRVWRQFWELPKFWRKCRKSKRPKRSFLFLFPTAEEQGLFGADFYSQNPLIPLE